MKEQTMNSNPLIEILPAEVRRWVYFGLGLAAIAVFALQTADGDWLMAVSAGLGALGFSVAGSNTATPEEHPLLPLHDADGLEG